MGIFGGDSKSLSAPGQAGSQTQVGDPLAVNLSGKGNYAELNVENTLTDHGAIGDAFLYGDRSQSRSAGVMVDALKRSLNFAGEGQDAAFKTVREGQQKSLDFAGDTVKKGFDLSTIVALGMMERQSDTLNAAERLVSSNNDALASVVQGESVQTLRRQQTITDLADKLKWPLALGLLGGGIYYARANK